MWGEDGCRWRCLCKKRKKNWANWEGKIKRGVCVGGEEKVVMTCVLARERVRVEVSLSVSSAPALWFLWGTDVHNLIQCLIPLYSLSLVPAPPTVCLSAHTHTGERTHTSALGKQSYIAVTLSYECSGVFTCTWRTFFFFFLLSVSLWLG